MKKAIVLLVLCVLCIVSVQAKSEYERAPGDGGCGGTVPEEPDWPCGCEPGTNCTCPPDEEPEPGTRPQVKLTSSSPWDYRWVVYDKIELLGGWCEFYEMQYTPTRIGPWYHTDGYMRITRPCGVCVDCLDSCHNWVWHHNLYEPCYYDI